MVNTSWQVEAKHRWRGEVVWVIGEGQFALIVWCGYMTITLWETRAEAEKEKERIGRETCSDICTGNHEIFDLSIA